MPRSLYKGPFLDPSVLLFQNQEERIRIWSRRSMILPSFCGKKCEVYNGKAFITLLVTEDMIGHKFGEFAVTRKKGIHTKKGQKK